MDQGIDVGVVDWLYSPSASATLDQLLTNKGARIPGNGVGRVLKHKLRDVGRADVVGIFPNPAAFLRVATAVVIESHDEWKVTRRYVSDVSMDELRAVITAKERAAAAKGDLSSLALELENA